MSDTEGSATNGRVTRSLKEEKHEILTVLDLKRTPRAEKMAAERALYEGVGEVEIAEKSHHRRRHESLDDVRDAVDALPERRALASGHASASAPMMAQPSPVPDPTPSPEAMERAAHSLSVDERALIQRIVSGELVDATVLYATSAGRAVEARYATEAGEERSLFILEDGVVRDVTDVEAKADNLRPRKALAAPKPRESAPQVLPEAPKPVAPGPEKKSRFALPKMGKKKEEKQEEAPKAEAPKAPPEPAGDPPKKRFGLPFRKKP